MRFSLAVAVAVAGITVGGLAQQKNTFKVKPSHTNEKAPKRTAPIGKTTASPATTSTSASRDLQNLERQTAKSSASARPAGHRTPGKAPALKPAKSKPSPPINFGGTGGGKSAGTTTRGSNPYKGRLKQKHAHR